MGAGEEFKLLQRRGAAMRKAVKTAAAETWRPCWELEVRPLESRYLKYTRVRRQH